MKVMLVTSGYYPRTVGGVEVYTHDLAHALAKHHTVCVFTRISEISARRHSVEHWHDGPVSVYGIATPHGYHNFRETFRNAAVEKCFTDILTLERPSVMHVQHCAGLSAHLLNLAAEQGVPTLATLHDLWYLCPNFTDRKPNGELCSQNLKFRDCPSRIAARQEISAADLAGHLPVWLKRISPDSWKRQAKFLIANLRTWAKTNRMEVTGDATIAERDAFVTAALSSCTALRCPSRFLHNRYTEFGLPADRLQVAPLGIDTNGMRARRRPLGKKLRFGYLGTLDPLKGVYVLAEAFAALRDPTFELTLYGDPAINPPCSRALRRRLRRCPARFAGPYDRRQLPTALDQLDVLILPSVVEENFPLVIQEAFAAKIPVIAARIGALPELVVPGKTGWLFTAGDARSLAATIQGILKHPQTISALQHSLPAVKTITQEAAELTELYQAGVNVARTTATNTSRTG